MIRQNFVRAILALGLMAFVTGHAHAQYFVKYDSAQPLPAPQSPYVGNPGGCYTGGGGGGACYSITAPTGNWSCYTPTMQPSCPDYTQHPPTPCWDTLCHDTVSIDHKVVLNRYYPVYIHLKEGNHYRGVQIEEKWQPVCILCTKTNPCSKHKGDQAPADLPAPTTTPGASSATSPTSPAAEGPVTHPVQQASGGDAPAANSAPVGPAPSAPSPVPDQIATPAPAQTTTPAPVPVAPVTAAAEAPAPAPAKQWVWLAYEGVWGYGYQRVDGYWEIDPGSRRAPATTNSPAYQVASSPAR